MPRPQQTAYGWGVVHFFSDKAMESCREYLEKQSEKGCFTLHKFEYLGESSVTNGPAAYIQASYSSQGACQTDMLSIITGELTSRRKDGESRKQYHLIVKDWNWTGTIKNGG